ncbi:hypothetical protein AVEN_226161-1 [Araneus ventricosus]|uniref:Uncharacterized protein n=1 Tax=Araneus ventricosus TaxID=182803 RepID=A0A4Y2TP41_ARAVE|nr:hypothetical protein AVEN_226161-1 [Araneus ventricosus]
MFSIEDCIIQLATPVSTPGHAPVRFRPPTVRRKREKADESISRIHMSTKPPYTKVYLFPMRWSSAEMGFGQRNTQTFIRWSEKWLTSRFVECVSTPFDISTHRCFGNGLS